MASSEQADGSDGEAEASITNPASLYTLEVYLVQMDMLDSLAHSHTGRSKGGARFSRGQPRPPAGTAPPAPAGARPRLAVHQSPPSGARPRSPALVRPPAPALARPPAPALAGDCAAGAGRRPPSGALARVRLRRRPPPSASPTSSQRTSPSFSRSAGFSKMDKANWDAYHTKIFCEICKEETEKHNRPGGYLSPKGYNNLEEKFFELTKKRRTRRQFKNKWDQLKKEYARFMELKNSATGLGWNDKMGTIEADDSWWDIHLKKYPGHAKWRYMGPPNLKEMDVMFENAHVTGETASIPGEISSSSDDDAIAEVKESEDLETPLKSFKKKGGQGKTLGKRKSKSHVEDEEDKNPFLRAYKQTLGKINSRVSEGSANHVPKVTAPTMGEVLNLMVECGAEEGTSLFHTATKIVMKPEYRELFMLIKTKEGRFDWLTREHEAMSK
ncbi:L10-interacting MYB domain-containing protein-like [Hordeum vulgare]|nr:L10-interacting MYB domain-containing protein-like [Hordeum vulgare]